MKLTIENLNDAIPKNAISQRSQSGTTLSYVEGWYVIDRLNQIFGPLNWEKTVKEVKCVQSEQYTNSNKRELWRVGYTCSVLLTIRSEFSPFNEGSATGTKSTEDYGFGQGIDADLGKAHESAIKEAVTDALKRCAKDLGMSFGLELYSKGKAQTTQELSIAAQPPIQDEPSSKVGQWLKSHIVAEDDSTQAKNRVAKARKDLWKALLGRFGSDAEKVLLGCDDLAQAEASIKVVA